MSAAAIWTHLPMQAPPLDPTHWLYRLSAADWLAAATNELASAEAAFTRHGFRTGVTHCRRSAGMALNAVLWQGERPAWGRSYMEHVTALAADAGADIDVDVPAELRDSARLLRETPAQAPPLVQLARPGQLDPAARKVLAATRTIIEWATSRTPVVS
jgi:hypothetical protein